MAVVAPLDPVRAGLTAAADAATEFLIDKDVSVDKLVLDTIGKGIKNFNATESVLDAVVKETMNGAPTLTLTIHDPERRLLNSNRLWYMGRMGNRRVRRIEVKVDSRPYVLVKVSVGPGSGAGVDLGLTFEHKLVWLMRQYDKVRKVSRGRMTLAEFMQTLAREIKEVKVRFVSPQLHKKQPIQKLTKDDRKQLRDSNKEPGIGDGDKIKVKNVEATPAQRRTIDTVLREGARQGAREKVLIVAIMVITQESGAGVKKRNPTNSGVIGTFQQDSSYGTEAQRMDDEHAAREFFKRIIPIDKKSPNLSYAELGEALQRSGQGSLYAQWKEEATRTVKTFGGGTGSISLAYVKQYNYTRGQRGERESTWDCSQRYAELVNWRSFVVGKSSWYWISEPDLFKSRSRLLIKPGHDALVTEPNGDVDEGKRANTCQLTVRVMRWKVPPGCVVTLDGWGLLDGRWLVEEVERSLFSPNATVSLKQPTKPKAEPANEVETASAKVGKDGVIDVGDAKGFLAKAYAAAKAIDARHYPYKWGGGHDANFTPPYDCSGAVSAVLHAAGLLDGGPRTSGMFTSWGKPGRGLVTLFGNKDHIFMSFWINGREVFFGTSRENPGGGAGFHSARSSAGFVVRSVGNR